MGPVVGQARWSGRARVLATKGTELRNQGRSDAEDGMEQGRWRFRSECLQCKRPDSLMQLLHVSRNHDHHRRLRCVLDGRCRGQRMYLAAEIRCSHGLFRRTAGHLGLLVYRGMHDRLRGGCAGEGHNQECRDSYAHEQTRQQGMPDCFATFRALGIAPHTLSIDV